MADRAQLADFLRTRREALQPEDVGLPRGPRRRTGGLRREEVAALCGMSADYYSRIEQQRGPNPSEQMLAAIARGPAPVARRAGPPVPHRRATRRRSGRCATDHINPGMMRILDRLDDTPAMVITRLGETLRQTRMAMALLGDETRFTGMARSIVYRWFTDPAVAADLPGGGSPDPRSGVHREAARRLPAARARAPGPPRSWTRCSPPVPSSRRSGREHDITVHPPRMQAHQPPASWASSSCSARRCSTPTSRRPCWSSPRHRAPTATRSCSCSPSSATASTSEFPHSDARQRLEAAPCPKSP